MTLNKAIKFLAAWSKNIITLENERHKQALDLSIEALKREQRWRQQHPAIGRLPLPGETKE